MSKILFLEDKPNIDLINLRDFYKFISNENKKILKKIRYSLVKTIELPYIKNSFLDTFNNKITLLNKNYYICCNLF